MKWMTYLGTALFSALLLNGCALKARQVAEAGPRTTATAQVGIVNHTGKYIYSASVDGAGGANMARWGAGGGRNLLCLYPESVVSGNDGSGAVGYAGRTYAYC